MPVIFITRNRQKGEIDSGENCHEENTREEAMKRGGGGGAETIKMLMT